MIPDLYICNPTRASPFNKPPGMEPHILIVDDHSMIRKGLKIYLQLNLGYTNISEAATCGELMKELLRKDYTHLILDIVVADGSTLEVIPNIARVYPKLKILIFSMQPVEVYGEALKQWGVRYYLSKSLGEDEIIHRLRQFFDDELPPAHHHDSRKPGNPFSALTSRELEILHYLLKGMGTKEMAEILNLKMSTISTIKTRIYEKTGAGNIKELMELATLYNVNY